MTPNERYYFYLNEVKKIRPPYRAGIYDHPASLEEHLDWLKESGFTVGCLQLSLNRALFAGVKV
jgi:hypothetical protein